jgi:transmembrane sensor
MSEAQSETAWNRNALAIQSVAAAWIERRESEAWCAADQDELDGWIAASPAHLVAYLRTNDVWEKANRLRALSVSAGTPQTPNRSRYFAPARLKIAAIFLMIPLAGALALGGYLSIPKQQTYTTTVGGHETLKLDDGSQVELNTDTAVRVSFDTQQRRVWLDKGEAYFRVVHDRARSFIVLAGDKRVIDLGTEFLVRRDPNAVKVALFTGRARFDNAFDSARATQTTLVPGDVVTANGNSFSLTKQTAQALANQLSWQRGMLVFDHTSLADVAGEYNRYNQQKIVIADASAARLTISGTLPANDITAFARVARKFFNLHIEKMGSEIVVSR